MQAKFEGFGEGAKAILGGKLAELIPQERVSIISKELKVQTTYTRALETLLGRATDALYISDSKLVLPVIQQLDS